MKVELMLGVLVNGRPLWRLNHPVKAEMSHRLQDSDYERVAKAAALELERRIVTDKKSKAEKED